MLEHALHQYPLEERPFKLICSLMPYNMNFITHYHQEIEIIYMVKGSLSMTVHHQDMLLEEGDLVIVGSNQIHGYNPDIYKQHQEDERQYYLLIFDMEVFRTMENTPEVISLFYGVNRLNCLDTPALMEIVPYLAQLSQEKTPMKGTEWMQMSHLFGILGAILRHGQLIIEKPMDTNRIKHQQLLLGKVNQFVEAHYQEGLQLKQVATALGYSEFHFSRQFKKYASLSFKQYLTHYQITMTRMDLIQTDLPITEIAFKNGFNSVKTFNRLFKNYYHTSPTQYRLENKNNKK